MENFKLWMGCLGNGITVCNSAVEESGDYKHIAHISDNGKIALYVPKSYIPVEDMQRIEQAASEQRKTFLNEWNKQSDIRKYEKLLDMCTISDLTYVSTTGVGGVDTTGDCIGGCFSIFGACSPPVFPTFSFIFSMFFNCSVFGSGSFGVANAWAAANFSFNAPIAISLIYIGAVEINSFAFSAAVGHCFTRLNGNIGGGTPMIPTI